MKLIQLLNSNETILADGAMGTYYSEITGNPSLKCELANIEKAGIIKKIHNDYIEAGANLIRTNTFSANTAGLCLEIDEVLKIVKAGFKIAKECAGDEVVVVADIGPIFSSDEKSYDDEYKKIIDCFASLGATDFCFETFSDVELLLKCASYVKENVENSSVIASFTFTSDGYTRNATALSSVVRALNSSDFVDVIGLNCGIGPTSMLNLVKSISECTKPLSVLPNAGYPTVVNARTIFSMQPNYFAQTMLQMEEIGCKILGGCCGTNPKNINALSKILKHPARTFTNTQSIENIQEHKTAKLSRIARKLEKNKFCLIAELDPPYTADLSKILSASEKFRDVGFDAITISDSPLARSRIDSIISSAKIKREIRIDVIPHICCRDKNINALRSSVLGAYSENIYNILSITGDPIPEEFRGAIKPVFNVNSQQLMSMISTMNNDVFPEKPILIGGAFNPNAKNIDIEIKRVKKKIECGAKFLLTQPVYEKEKLEIINKVRACSIKVFVGIMPLVSWRNANYMNNEVPGIHVPDEIMNRFKENMPKDKAVEIGIEIATEFATFAKNYCDGFYFMTPFNRADIVCEIVQRLKNNNIL